MSNYAVLRPFDGIFMCLFFSLFFEKSSFFFFSKKSFSIFGGLAHDDDGHDNELPVPGVSSSHAWDREPLLPMQCEGGLQEKSVVLATSRLVLVLQVTRLTMISHSIIRDHVTCPLSL